MTVYAVDIEGGWLAIIEAPDKRSAERQARRVWAEGTVYRPSDIEASARKATSEDIAWHKAMGGSGGAL